MEDALRRRGRRAAPRAAPAALLRRVDREPRAARLHAPRARLPRLRERDRAWRRDHPRAWSQRGLAAQEGRQRRDRRSSAGARSTRSTSASAASTARRHERSSRRCAEQLEAGARDAARDGALGRGASTSPTSSATTSSSRCGTRRIPDRPKAGSSRTAASTSPSREFDEHFVEEHVAHSNALHARSAAARRVPRRPAGALQPRTSTGSRRSRRRPRARPGSSAPCRNPFKSIVVRAVEIALRAATRRSRSSTTTSEPDAPARRGRAPRAAIGYGVHRGAARDPLPPLRARRRRHDPRREDRAADLAEPARRSRRTCAAFVERHARPAPTTSSTCRCEQAIRNYDPCISCATHFLDARGRAVLRVDRRRQPAGAATTRRASRRSRARGHAARASRCSSTRASRPRCSTWDGAESVWLVDAISRERRPPRSAGSTRASRNFPPRLLAPRLTTSAWPRPRARPRARQAASAPVVYGIEGATFDIGDELTSEVRAASERAARAIREEVLACTSGR